MADLLLEGQDIGKVLNSDGPVVTCVVLRAAPSNDVKNENADNGDDDKKKSSIVEGNEDQQSEALQSLVEEVKVDTTPKKNMVCQILGGPFTFLGQYEEEGIVLMVRRPIEEDAHEDDSDECRETGNEQETNTLPPLNPHKLQPPFDKSEVRGDILIIKVASTDEMLDDEEENNDDEKTSETDKGSHDGGENEDGETAISKETVAPPSNDEFFLDYTKKEYTKFAARTDVVAPPEQEVEHDDEDIVDGDESNDEEENGNDNDEEYQVGEDDEFDSDDDEDAPVAMMNLIMGQVLRKFQEEHGRGPDTRELLELRSALAEKLGVEVPEVDEQEADWDQKAIKKKRETIETLEVSDSAEGGDSMKSPVKSILTRKRTFDEGEEEGIEEPEGKRVKFNYQDFEAAATAEENYVESQESAATTEKDEEPSEVL